jgi:hypothetical protein
MAEPVSDVKARASRFTRKVEAAGTGVSPIKVRQVPQYQADWTSTCLQ